MKASSLGEIIVLCSFSLSILIVTFMSGCSTSTVVDEQKSSSTKLSMDSEEKIVIIGRSKLVGIPLALLLSSKTAKGNATVTICHSKSKDI